MLRVLSLFGIQMKHGCFYDYFERISMPTDDESEPFTFMLFHTLLIDGQMLL